MTSFYLFIDTSQEEQIRLAVFDRGQIISKKILRIGHHYSEKIISGIDEILISRGRMQTRRRQTRTFKNLEKLKGVLVVNGPGRFSALRTGISVANTLAWSLNAPVVGLKAFRQAQGGSFNEVVKYWQEMEMLISENVKQLSVRKKFDQFIIPQYGKEPNITV